MSNRKQLKITILEAYAKKLQSQMERKLEEIEELSKIYDKSVKIIHKLKGIKPQYCESMMPDMDASTVILNKMRKARSREKRKILDGKETDLTIKRGVGDLDDMDAHLTQF
jgi:hypothetical protein